MGTSSESAAPVSATIVSEAWSDPPGEAFVDARVSPMGSLENLSQREVAQLLSAGNDGAYQLFRRCALAVLNSGNHTDDAPALFERYRRWQNDSRR